MYRITAACLASASWLFACGQAGDLYVPEKEAQAKAVVSAAPPPPRPLPSPPLSVEDGGADDEDSGNDE